MKDLEEQYVTVLDDFQHTVENKIRNHKDEVGFPLLPANVSEEELSNYLLITKRLWTVRVQSVRVIQ